MLEASITVQIGDGMQTKFLSAKWLGGKSIKELTPLVFQAVTKRMRKLRLVSQALLGETWRQDITGALSWTATQQYLRLSDLI